MSVKVEDFTSNIISQTEHRASVFLRLLADEIVENARPNTPKDKGNLSRDILRIVTGLHGSVDWRKTYASYQERGSRADGSRKVKNYTTPGTGPHYAENAVEKAVKNSNAIAKLAHLI